MRADGRIDLDRIAGSGAAPGDRLVYDGARWVPAADEPTVPVLWVGTSAPTDGSVFWYDTDDTC